MNADCQGNEMKMRTMHTTWLLLASPLVSVVLFGGNLCEQTFTHNF